MTLNDIAYPLASFVGLLLMEGLFSGSEIALVAADRKELHQLASEGHKGAASALKLLNNPNWFFSVTLLATSLTISANTVLTTAWILDQWACWGEWIAVLLIPPFVLIFGEIIPKTVFQQRAQYFAPRVAYVIVAATFVLYPLAWILARLSQALTSVSEKKQPPFVTREELKLILRMDMDEVELDTSERRLIRKMFSFAETTVSRVMIPLIKVSAVPEDASLTDAVAKFRQTGYGRLPVYRKRIDDMVGILHSFDLIGEIDQTQPVGRLMRAAHYVPETKPVAQLLVEMQGEGKTIGVVVDEYGGTIGIVTVEDLLEEVMGEMADEFDNEAPLFATLGTNHYLVKGRMEISQINEQLPLGIPRGEYETIAGFILKELGFIPQEGYAFSYGQMQFVIRKCDIRAIEEVEIIVKRKGHKK